jgi:glucosamine-6-phosphate deaminase
MDVVVVEEHEALGRMAASIVLEAVRTQPDLVLGVATGSSPLPIYRALRDAQRSGTDFSRVRCVALDEYLGLEATDPASYHSFVHREIAVPLGLRPENVLVPDGAAPDPAAACVDFEQSLADLGGVALQLLGLGRNGHLGFNEPGSSFASRTRVTTLSPSTREANARFFADIDQVPTHSITQGLGTILEAGRLVLVASGALKAPAVAAALQGPPSETCPASLLQIHAHATVIIDRSAAADLAGTDGLRQAAEEDDWLH